MYPKWRHTAHTGFVRMPPPARRTLIAFCPFCSQELSCAPTEIMQQYRTRIDIFPWIVMAAIILLFIGWTLVLYCHKQYVTIVNQREGVYFLPNIISVL